MDRESHRIVSLIPSATEIVSALGARPQLVGRSHECDWPAGIEAAAVCSEPRIDVRGSSREIDQRVRVALEDALSVYRVFESQLERLQPTVIVTQTQCDVCAVSLSDVEQAVERLTSCAPRIVSCAPNTLADIWDDFHRVGAAIGRADAATRLVLDCQQRLGRIQALCAQADRRPVVACVEWLDPLMVAGNWIPELVEIASGTSLLAEPGVHSPWINWPSLRDADPDVIAVMPCGFDISRSMRELELLAGLPGWSELKAVRNGRVFVTDGNQYFNRPGPRVVESAEILVELLHPGLADFGHEGQGWVRWDSRGSALD